MEAQKRESHPIARVNRVFTFAMTNPPDYEFDARVLDLVSELWDQVLFEHWPQGLKLTEEQRRNLIFAWRFEERF